MDVTIANLHISVHRTIDHKRPELTLTRVEHAAKQAAQLRRVEMERQQLLNWYTLHGGH